LTCAGKVISKAAENRSSCNYLISENKDYAAPPTKTKLIILPEVIKVSPVKKLSVDSTIVSTTTSSRIYGGIALQIEFSVVSHVEILEYRKGEYSVSIELNCVTFLNSITSLSEPKVDVDTIIGLSNSS